MSIITAAKDEERNIRPALLSLLKLDYPNLEVIVVNDRSNDNTGKILGELSKQYDHLTVIHNTTLPDNWLGKNYGLHRGAAQATGELLLFTDADVMMAPSTLKRGVSYLFRNNLEHIAVTPEMDIKNIIVDMFGSIFPIYFSIYALPWKVKKPKSRYHVGIGAFNLVKKDVYWENAGHQKIRMNTDDDMQLGKLVKLTGGKQEMLFGTGLISVEWYSNLKNLVNGLMKNSFTAFWYNPFLAVLGAVVQLFLIVFPFIAVFITNGLTQIFYLIAMHMVIITYLRSLKYTKAKHWYVVFIPFVVLLFIFIQLKTIIIVLWKGGIYWKGTFYSLESLKQMSVRYNKNKP